MKQKRLSVIDDLQPVVSEEVSLPIWVLLTFR